MLETLLKVYYQAHAKYQSLTLRLTHDKIADWELLIEHGDSHAIICHANGFFLTDLAVQGYIALNKWLDKKDDANEYLASAQIF